MTQDKHTTAEEYMSRLRFRAAYNDCLDAYGGTRELAFKGVVGREFVVITRETSEWRDDRKYELLIWVAQGLLLRVCNERHRGYAFGR